MASASRITGPLAAALIALSCAHSEPALPESTGVVRVPITLDGGMPWIEASVGGRPVRLLLDLGGFDAVALAPEELSRMEVTWTGQSITTITAMGETAKAREYVLRDFELGGIVFPEIRGYEDLLQGSPRGVARSGYVGLGLLRRFRIIIDYPSRHLVLIWPDAQMPAPYDVENWSGHLFAGGDGVKSRVKIEGVERTFVWDTGVTHCVLRAGLQGRKAVRNQAGHQFVTVNSFEVAGHEAGPMEFALLGFKEPKADGFVGYTFFANHAVYVDFRNRYIAVRP